MRILLPLSCALLASTTQAQLLPFLSKFTASKPSPQDPSNQRPIMADNNPPSDPSGDIILSDILGSQRPINIFFNFCNSITSVSSRLSSSSQNTTVLAPLNSAIQSLPRKPWEDPRDYNALGANAYSGANGEDRAQRNMRRFVEAHIVPTSPWQEGEKVQTMGGGTVWWESRGDGERVIMPGAVEIERVAKKVGNGEVWILKGVVNYA